MVSAVKRRLVLLTAALMSFAMIGGILLAADQSDAAMWPLSVSGHVRDNVGNPVASAPVTINVRWESTDAIRSTLTTTTNGAGFYERSFLPGEWDEGDRIEVIATNPQNSDQESASVFAGPIGVEEVDVIFPYEIPEFGIGFWGYIAAGGAVAAVGVALLVFWKRK